MARKKLRVGFDFDGVIAYNPLRIFRFPFTLFRRVVLGEKKVYFPYPKTKLERFVWWFGHELSFFPATGIQELKEHLKKGTIEGYLITARYSFLEKSLDAWLTKHRIKHLFKGIYSNNKDEQPHLFKEQMITRLKLDMFVEDNWDIVQYLNSKLKRQNSKRKQIEIHWIYNIVDRFNEYHYKHPYLKKFLERLS